MKRLLIIVSIVAATFVASPAFAQTTAALGADPSAVNLARTQPVTCNPSSTISYPQYNVARGQWQCVPPVRVVNRVSGIRSGTAANALTITVPLTTVSANIHVRIFASLGAGGSVGAYECSAVLEGNIVIARTSSKAAVVTASTAGQTASSCVTSAETITLAYAVTSPTGSTTGIATSSLTVTITPSGAAQNHEAIVEAQIINNVNAGAMVTIN